MVILDRHERESGYDYAIRVLKYNIIHLGLLPGSMVSEARLGEEMGISRTPVRSALQDLSKIKIVEIYPQIGNVISLIDYDLVEEVRFFRCTMECAIVELLCNTITMEQIISLEENIKLSEYCLVNSMTGKLLDLDNDFHRLLFQYANKMNMYSVMEDFMIHFDRVRMLVIESVKDLAIIKEHRELVDLIKNKQVDSARQCIKSHLMYHRLDKEDLMAKYPDYFKK